jgi:CRP-like cAMP-binding protein
MEPELLNFLSHIPFLNEEERNAIAADLTVRRFKKGTVLLKEGEISSECYFVLKGCLRQYYLVEGEEKTTAFFTEQQAVTSFASYTEQTPSSHYLCCVEDVTLIVGNFSQEKAMYQKYPKLALITRSMMEQDYGKTQEQFAAFITSSPEKRYLDLLENRPDLLQRVPQHQLASYLGITPESLSRIRKRILAKK